MSLKKNCQDKNKENGSIMVEAALYLPLTVFVVFAMIYFGMVKYQDSILTFRVQKYATQRSREVAYPGYAKLTGEHIGGADIDLRDEASFDFASYYEARSERLYNEWKFNYTVDEKAFAEDLEAVLSETSFLTGIQTETNVSIENYVISQRIKVDASYQLEGPAFLRQVGVPSLITLKSSVVQSASNPAELVRNTDLACDMLSFFLEKLGIKDKVDSFFSKVAEIKDKFLKE